jgi:hypothetical protein
MGIFQHDAYSLIVCLFYSSYRIIGILSIGQAMKIKMESKLDISAARCYCKNVKQTFHKRGGLIEEQIRGIA